jgi:hypothetical protein
MMFRLLSPADYLAKGHTKIRISGALAAIDIYAFKAGQRNRPFSGSVTTFTPLKDYLKRERSYPKSCSAFTERYGDEEVKTCYFEVWNELNRDGFALTERRQTGGSFVLRLHQEHLRSDKCTR